MRPPFKLCTFDITNTLLKFQLPVGEQYARVGRLYGVDRDPLHLTASFLQNWKLMNTHYPNYGRKSGLTSRLWWKEMVKRVFYSESSRITSDQLDSISDYLYDVYKTDSCWKVIPGAKQLLQNLKAFNINLGVISNFDERLDCVLTSTGLKSHFNFILASYDVGIEKPNKKIFDMALQQQPGLEPTDAIHIGDNVNLDYLGAKAAGWNALLMTDPTVVEEYKHLVDHNDIVQNVMDIEKNILNN